MMRTTWWALGLAAVIGLGCGETTDTGAPTDSTTATTDAIDATPADSSAVEATPAEEPADTGAEPGAATDTETTTDGTASTTEVELSEEEIAQIEKLPAEDQVLALAQKVCPASGEPLGSMGVPIKVSGGEKPVFVCCKGCVEEVEKDPAAALAKLGQK